MANPKLKKLIRKYKGYWPVLLILLFPLGFGVFTYFKVKEHVFVLNRKLAVAGLQTSIAVDTFYPGFLRSHYGLSIRHTNVDETIINTPVKLVVANVPGAGYLSKGQMHFAFSLELERISFVKELRGTLHEIDLEGLVLDGGYILPSRLEANGKIALLETKDKKFQGRDLDLALEATAGEWLATATGTDLKLRAFDVDMTLLQSKLTLNGDVKSSTNDYGFTIGFQIKVPTHSESNLRFNFGGTIHNVPTDLGLIEREGMKAYAASRAGFDVSASLSLGKPAFKSIAKGTAVDNGVEVEGTFDIDIPEQYQKDKLVVPIVQFLSSNADEFRANYNVDLNQQKVTIPFNVKDRNFLLNGKRFYSCVPPMAGITQRYRQEDLRAVTAEEAKMDALEDLLAEDVLNRLGESYCRVHYAYEFSDKTDAALAALMQLLRVKGHYLNEKAGGDTKLEMIALRKLKADLVQDEELLLLASAFNCYLNKNGTSCTSKLELIPHQNDAHPFKKLLDVAINGTTEPLAISGLVAPAESKPYLKRAYELLQAKALHAYYTSNKLVRELAESINSKAPIFGRNFMRYQAIDYACAFLKDADCIQAIERSNPDFSSPRYATLYLDLRLRVFRVLREKKQGPNCTGFVSELAAKIPLSLSHPGFQLLMQECPGGYVAPAPAAKAP